jgi:hypothetical protein
VCHSFLIGWQDVDPSDDVEVADWIRERFHPFATDVGSVVASGFEAYARIFHPAREPRQGPDQTEHEVRWSTVAGWNEKVVHPEMQFHSIGGPWHGKPQRRGPRIYEPRTGVLSDSQCRVLVQLLSKHTATPNACWLCLWDGYGYLSAGGIAVLTARSSSDQQKLPSRPRRFASSDPSRHRSQPLFRDRKRVRLPNRDYLLFKAPATAASGWQDGPNLWWPEDRAWCVASEIDFPYTYVGGSTKLIEEILGHPDLEALPATLTDDITAMSDKINA